MENKNLHKTTELIRHYKIKKLHKTIWNKNCNKVIECEKQRVDILKGNVWFEADSIKRE